MDIVNETQGLYQRFEKSEAFQHYVRSRMGQIVPVLVVFLLFSLATTAAVVLFLGGTRSVVVLLGLIGAPFLLIGSLFVQVFTLFWWLEWRAIDSLSGRAPKAPAGMPRSLADVRALLGRPPAVPWGLAAVFLLVPWLALAWLSKTWAVMLLLLWIATPFLYSLSDRE